jgi:hypothetical protein
MFSSFLSQPQPGAHTMKAEEVRSIARIHQIDIKGLSKTNMIKEIQRNEGNFDCYASAFGGECDQSGCLWRVDCLKESQG